MRLINLSPVAVISRLTSSPFLSISIYILFLKKNESAYLGYLPTYLSIHLSLEHFHHSSLPSGLLDPCGWLSRLLAGISSSILISVTVLKIGGCIYIWWNEICIIVGL
jgi:hypothetical protein